MNDNPGAIDDEAGLWFARMDGENDAAHRPAFEAWLDQSPLHRRSYARLVRVYRGAEVLRGTSGNEDACSALTDRESRTASGEPLALWRSRASRMISLAVAATLILSVGIGFWMWGQRLTSARDAAGAAVMTFETKRGEIRQVHLADGSVMTLDTSSRALVMMGAQRRSVRLVTGHARFVIAGDARPFDVDAGEGRLTAHNAIFDVDVGGDRKVEVGVIGGQARLASMIRVLRWIVPVQTIDSGQSVHYASDQYMPALQPSVPSAIDRKEWTSGWVVCRSIRLETLLAEANRYSVAPVVLEDPRLEETEMTGRFRVAATDTFVGHLADQFDLAVVRDEQGIHLRPK